MLFLLDNISKNATTDLLIGNFNLFQEKREDMTENVSCMV